MEDAIEEIELTGFDPEGEPVVRRTATGRLWLCVQFVPPSWAEEIDPSDRVGLGPWHDFDKRLQRAIGVPVVWEDREWFRIDQPKPDTVEAIRAFLLDLRRDDPNPARGRRFSDGG
jgi:hypothetical protein